MTDQEMRIAIAEACPVLSLLIRTGIVDPLYDLNAMHEAWIVGIKNAEADERFCRILRQVACPSCAAAECSNVINAAARQRAEAFLRTIGKWKD